MELILDSAETWEKAFREMHDALHQAREEYAALHARYIADIAELNARLHESHMAAVRNFSPAP